MLQVHNLGKSYGSQTVFENASFSLIPGERLGLVGRNGSGKTTLFRIIAGEEHQDSGVVKIPEGYTLGRLSQHIRFTAPTVLEEGCLSLRTHESEADESYKVKTILHGLGFRDADFALSPQALSGGYQVRLSLAKVLINEPNLLLLDEPTNYLDIVSIRWLAKFLRSWQHEFILITHDREFMDSVTSHTMAIHRSLFRKTAGSTTKLYDQILLDEEVHERTRLNDEKKRKDAERFITRFRAQANKARAVQSRIKALAKKTRLEKLRDEKGLEFSFREAPFTGKQLLTVSDLSFGFPAQPPLISGLDLAVAKQDRIAVIGRNGKGKTTLLNLLADEFAPSQGEITRHPQLRQAYFGQTNVNRLNEGRTVEEEIMDANPDLGRGKARDICGAMMFSEDLALKKISVLSGGERARVLLGKILAHPANLLLLDEPTNHLDMESIDSLVEAINEFNGAVIIVTHSEMILDAVAERLLIFDRGGVRLFEGGYRDFLEKVGWEDETSDTAPATDEKPVARARSADRKELKRLKAELINERSRTLTPLAARIAELEGLVIHLEAEVEADTERLVAASQKGDAGAIGELSRNLQNAKAAAEKNFHEMVELTEKHDRLSKEFEERLSSLSQ